LVHKIDIDVIYEFHCEECGAEGSIVYVENEDGDEPVYCPFCGADINSVEEDDDIDELDFDYEGR